jgi:exodeoxyribonuclease-3
MEKTIKLISWNVNGIRAAYKKGFMDWFNEAQPDILGLQETRATPDQLAKSLREPAGYHTYWLSATSKKGYSGVGLYSKVEPLKVSYGLGIEKFDVEGRVMVAEYAPFSLINAYFPSGTSGMERVDYKLAFNHAFLKFAEKLRRDSGKPVVFCGDINTAHQEIDLARPKENVKTSGFMPIEREWIDEVVAAGYIDAFRHLNPDMEGQYTWWTQRTNARERNVGWRIDYFFISQELEPALKAAHIWPEVTGSDHCPLGIELALSLD